MTEQEVLEIITEVEIMRGKEKHPYIKMKSFEDAYHDCVLVADGIFDDESFQYADSGLVMYYLANIVKALEKQIAKKPNIEGDGYADGQLVYDTWICPNCEKHYEIDYDDYDYCPNCGQKILWDWGNEDAE